MRFFYDFLGKIFFFLNYTYRFECKSPFYCCMILKQISTFNSATYNFKKLHSDVVSRLQTDRQTEIYTGCPRRNVPDFGRVFLMLKYTDITQNTYVQS